MTRRSAANRGRCSNRTLAGFDRLQVTRAQFAAAQHHHELSPIVDEVLRPVGTDLCRRWSVSARPPWPRAHAVPEASTSCDGREPRPRRSPRRAAPPRSPRDSPCCMRCPRGGRIPSSRANTRPIRRAANRSQRSVRPAVTPAGLPQKSPPCRGSAPWNPWKRRHRSSPHRRATDPAVLVAREFDPASPARSMRCCMRASSAGSMSIPTTERARYCVTSNSSMTPSPQPISSTSQSADIAALQHTRDLLGTARRQKSFAPDDLEQCQHGLIVFAGLTRLA